MKEIRFSWLLRLPFVRTRPVCRFSSMAFFGIETFKKTRRKKNEPNRHESHAHTHKHIYSDQQLIRWKFETFQSMRMHNENNIHELINWYEIQNGDEHRTTMETTFCSNCFCLLSGRRFAIYTQYRCSTQVMCCRCRANAKHAAMAHARATRCGKIIAYTKKYMSLRHRTHHRFLCEGFFFIFFASGKIFAWVDVKRLRDRSPLRWKIWNERRCGGISSPLRNGGKIRFISLRCSSTEYTHTK